jgi:urease accessory protein
LNGPRTISQEFSRAGTIAFALVLSAAVPAQAHHAMGGRTPATLYEGFLSGLGHPIIGIDHFAFIVAAGLVAGAVRLHLAAPAAFIAVSALGVGLHVRGIELPVAELGVAASVLLAGLLIARGAKIATPGWLSLFALAGVFHGYAYGESIVGAEPAPLAAYLAGLIAVQATLATGVAIMARRCGRGALTPRLAGAAIAGIGLAVLAGHLTPA